MHWKGMPSDPSAPVFLEGSSDGKCFRFRDLLNELMNDEDLYQNLGSGGI